jgi:hypothetical protein
VPSSLVLKSRFPEREALAGSGMVVHVIGFPFIEGLGPGSPSRAGTTMRHGFRALSLPHDGHQSAGVVR